MAFGKFIQGLAGNFSEQNKETLIKEYGQYLLELAYHNRLKINGLDL